MHQSPSDRDDPGFGTSINTRQEIVDRNILRVAPEKKPWLPPQRVLARLSDTTSDRYRIRLFDSSKLHKLDILVRVNFALNMISSSVRSLSIDGTVGITSVMVPHSDMERFHPQRW